MAQPSGSSIKVRCPNCQTTIQATGDRIDTRLTCPDCLEEFVVPRPKPQPKTVVARKPDSNETALDPSASEDWNADRQQLDLLLQIGSPAAPVPASTEGYEFTVACPLCGTRQDFSDAEIGKKVRCPDCHKIFELWKPSPASRRPKSGTTQRPDDDYGLDEPVAATVYQSLASDLLANAEREVQWEQPRKPPTADDAAHDTLRRAEREIESGDAKSPPKLPPSPLTSGVLAIFVDLPTALRGMFLALGLWVELGTIEFALASANAGGIAQFGSVMARIFATAFGALFLANFASTMLGIAKDSSHGSDEIESLPGVNPVEWFYEPWTIFASCFVVFAPCAMLGHSLSRVGNTAAWPIALIACGLGGATLFPVVQLSFMENSTPFSQPIFRGLRVATKHWFVFTGEAFGLSAMIAGCLAGRVVSSSSALNLFLCVVMTLAVMLFFRLLGRMAWACQELLYEHEKAHATAK